MKFYTAHKENFAQAIAQGILDGLGVKSTATQPKAEQYYRVRLAKDDEKSQLFAGTKAGALAVCKTKPGYSVFDPDMKCIYTNNAKGLQASALKGLSEKEWIEKVGPLYTADEKTSGILACVSLAQGILESGYGQTDLAQAGNNLHGMKTNLSGNTWPGTTWDGSSKYTKESPEQDANGNQYMKKSDFRRYGCIEESIADHSAYLLNAANGKKQRYAGLAGEKDYRKAAQIIKDGGYATDTKYVSKLVNIIEKWNLTRYNASGPGSTPKPSAAEDEWKVPFLINTTCDWLWIRKGPAKKYDTSGHITEKDGEKKKYTIVEVKNGWGRLKSGIGWICLDYVKKV